MLGVQTPRPSGSPTPRASSRDFDVYRSDGTPPRIRACPAPARNRMGTCCRPSVLGETRSRKRWGCPPLRSMCRYRRERGRCRGKRTQALLRSLPLPMQGRRTASIHLLEFFVHPSNTQGLRRLDFEGHAACRRIASRYSEVNPPLPPETASGRSEQDPTGQTVGAIGTMQNESSPTVGACAGATSAHATPMDTAHTVVRVAKSVARRMGFTSWGCHYRAGIVYTLGVVRLDLWSRVNSRGNLPHKGGRHPTCLTAGPARYPEGPRKGSRCGAAGRRATPRPTSVSPAPAILSGPNPSPSNTHDVPPPMIGTRYMNRDARATPRCAITQFHSVHATYTGTTTVQAKAAHPAGVMRVHA